MAAVIAVSSSDPSFVHLHPADAFVCTACPWIAVDDALRHKKPIVTPPELEIVLGVRPGKNYEFDQSHG